MIGAGTESLSSAHTGHFHRHSSSKLHSAQPSSPAGVSCRRRRHRRAYKFLLSPPISPDGAKCRLTRFSHSERPTSGPACDQASNATDVEPASQPVTSAWRHGWRSHATDMPLVRPSARVITVARGVRRLAPRCRRSCGPALPWSRQPGPLGVRSSPLGWYRTLRGGVDLFICLPRAPRPYETCHQTDQTRGGGVIWSFHRSSPHGSIKPTKNDCITNYTLYSENA